MTDWSLYTAPEEQITADLLRAFIDEQRDASLLTESMTLELKERRHGDNIAKAVAGFANAEGGIVLVGISEGDPSFDTAPGVPPSEVVAISDSCRNLLTPLVRPEIIPVRVGDNGNVVIVVRVNPDVSVLPVCKNGTVFVRAPGQTVPASREQIMSLATRSERMLSHAMQGPSLNDAFTPEYDQGPGSRDALIRVAGGVWLRPSANDVVFGTDSRRILRVALGASPLFLYPALNDFHWRRPENRPRCLESSFTASTATFVVDYPGDNGNYRATARLRRDGFRITYALDLEVRMRAEPDPTQVPRLGREELTTALVVGLETVAILLPDLVATIAKSAPQRLEPVQVWVQNSSMSFDSLLDLSQTFRASENSMGSQWGWEQAAPRTLEEVAAAVRAELERLYLNIGLDDAESVADSDLRRGLTERAHIVSELVLHEQ